MNKCSFPLLLFWVALFWFSFFETGSPKDSKLPRLGLKFAVLLPQLSWCHVPPTWLHYVQLKCSLYIHFFVGGYFEIKDWGACFVLSAENGTQGLTRAGQMLSHWVTLLAFSWFYIYHFTLFLWRMSSQTERAAGHPKPASIPVCHQLCEAGTVHRGGSQACRSRAGAKPGSLALWSCHTGSVLQPAHP